MSGSPGPQAFDPVPRVAEELGLPARGVAAVVGLLQTGATVPFIARYRKEATGSLDEVQIRAIEERRAYLVELEERRAAVLESIAQQGKLGPELRARLLACQTKAELEDLYLPFRPKRRTRASMARERGLEPLAARILAQPREGQPLAEAAAFVDAARGVPDADAALAGARDIVAEQAAEDAGLRAQARRAFATQGVLAARVLAARRGERTKFEQYYDYREPVARIPSHRYLAVRRGEREEVLSASIEVDGEALCAELERRLGLQPASPWAGELRAAVADGARRLLFTSLEVELRAELKQRSDCEAIEVFAANLKNLLLAAPLGGQPVVGIDPGLRTGCKCAAVDGTGKFLESVTLYPHTGRAEEAAAALTAFVRRHAPAIVAVGNGTAGRETQAFAQQALAGGPPIVLVSEAGASVYSASDVAREEFPELDVTVRGAISIARRLQDPLAELVKIEPKAIGVGQYQHDVDQRLLQLKLDQVVEDCVNQVGVELNTASASLLAYVAGVGPAAARRIVAHREAHGAFPTRAALQEVAGVGPRTFEQAAGFLRVRASPQPLDASAVHPERYALVARMADDLGVELGALVGNAALAARIEPARYAGGDVGEPTLRDILAELVKPGRDPRASFSPPAFREDVRALEDLRAGMWLEGVVTNVTHFGAFVDVGVKQDGLVHVSQLADRFVREPSEVVKAGDRVRVRVLEVDLERKRISLSCRSETAPKPAVRPDPKPAARPGPRRAPAPEPTFRNNPFAALRKKE
ncbi:MAG TPA: Tex family protein [Myxococcota bacterium]|nr:Tex family protein [Myxococcota bacterium]HRY97104.1 Tex family protein [Myxococcota bacterium]